MAALKKRKMDQTLDNEIEKVYESIKVKESCTLKQLLKEIDALKDATNQLTVQEDIISHEVQSPFTAINDYDENSIEEIQNRMLFMQQALIKQEMIVSATQKAHISAQVQKVMERSLQTIDGDVDINQKPHLRETIENYSQNMTKSKEIAKLEKTNEQLRKDILELRKRYIDAIHSIDGKWKHIVEGKGRETLLHNENYIAGREKLETRESRLSVLKGLLRALITGSNNVWGDNPRFVETLLLCDLHDAGIENIEENIKSLTNSSSVSDSTEE